MVIRKHLCDNEYVLNLTKWENVVEWLKERLDNNAMSILIEKWSANGRCLGRKIVKMNNFYKVVTSSTDKVLKDV